MSVHNMLWLEDDKVQGEKLNRIRDAFRDKENRNLNRGGGNCLHGSDHCTNIENAIHLLIPENQYEGLKPEERFLLLAVPWVLNIPWVLYANNNYDDHRLHEEAISWLQSRDNCDLIGINDQESMIFQAIIKYHYFSEDLDPCQARMPLGPMSVRVRLITAYFRLADAIHIDNCEGPTSLFSFLDQSNSPELYHWLKSKLRLKLRAILPDPDNEQLILNISSSVTSDNIKGAIKNNLLLHIEAVKTTLVKNALEYTRDGAYNKVPLPCYLSLSINIDESVACQPGRQSELDELMHEFDMSFSPSARSVQTLYIHTMLRVAENDLTDPQLLIQEILQLQAIASKVHSIRKCHIALGRYVREFDDILNVKESPINKISSIINWAKKSQEQYAMRHSDLTANAINALEKGEFNYFLIFGYSSTIVDIFREIKPKNEINIFVCEAHNKSRFDAKGRQIYNDGQQYAEIIREKNKSKNIFVSLIPDITVSSIFKEYNNKHIKWVALFGANGITPDGYCGHSAGHLSLAIICNKFNIPVCIMTDSYKIGSLPDKTGTDVGVNLIDIRNNQWLKDIPNWEQSKTIRLLNLRESVIEPDLITKIITENNVFSISEFQEYYKNTST